MKIQRLIAILTILLQIERISATKLAEKFEVSVRTIYRDIEALEQAGIPIVTHTGINGGISIMESYKIDKKLFTNYDIITLLTSLYSISSSIEDQQVNYTIEKIKALIPNEQLPSIELNSQQLYIDMSPWANHPYVSIAMQMIRAALSNHRYLQFCYSSRENNHTKRIVEPYQLVLKEHSWYLKAYCIQKKDFRVFKLSRMQNVEVLETNFEQRSFESGMNDFKNWKHEKKIIVHLIIDESLRERILEYCHEENIKILENGKMDVLLPFVESDMGYGVLMSMGNFAEVLAPKHVREELIRRFNLALQSYQ